LLFGLAPEQLLSLQYVTAKMIALADDVLAASKELDVVQNTIKTPAIRNN
jgi:hypothetical protein